MDLHDSEAFKAYLPELLRQHHVPGFAIAIIQNGKVASSAFGLADIDSQTPCTPDTLFDMASCSKSLTAASAVLLVGDNQRYSEIQYNAKMVDLLLGDFEMQDTEYTDGVTLHHVLGHTTGLASHDFSYMGLSAEHPDTALTITRNLRNLAVAQPPGAKHIYCNIMYTVLAHLIEVKTKGTFNDFLNGRFFRPLAMDSTTLQPSRARQRGFGDRLSKAHLWSKSAQQYKTYEIQEQPEAEGAGSVVSSVNDFVKWVQALLYKQGPVSETVYEGLLTKRAEIEENPRKISRKAPHASAKEYGGGLEWYRYRGELIVTHDGGEPGFCSRFAFLPGQDFGIVVASNAEDGFTVNSVVVKAFYDHIIGAPEEERHFEKLAAQFLAKRKSKSKKNDRKMRNEEEQKQENGEKQDDKVPGAWSGDHPPEHFVGTFYNAGYHSVTIQVNNKKPFIDATDRGMGFMLSFGYLRDKDKYVGYFTEARSWEDVRRETKVDFVWEGEKLVKIGIDLEPRIKELIWFDRRE